jgi:hypothetical protein
MLSLLQQACLGFCTDFANPLSFSMAKLPNFLIIRLKYLSLFCELKRKMFALTVGIIEPIGNAEWRNEDARNNSRQLILISNQKNDIAKIVFGVDLHFFSSGKLTEVPLIPVR